MALTLGLYWQGFGTMWPGHREVMAKAFRLYGQDSRKYGQGIETGRRHW